MRVASKHTVGNPTKSTADTSVVESPEPFLATEIRGKNYKIILKGEKKLTFFDPICKALWIRHELTPSGPPRYVGEKGAGYQLKALGEVENLTFSSFQCIFCSFSHLIWLLDRVLGNPKRSKKVRRVPATGLEGTTACFGGTYSGSWG